jgi:chromosome segregation ATPase
MMGAGIEQNLDVLKNHIKDLERQLVGKPAGEDNLNEQVQEIADISKRMQEDEKTANDECVKGELGKELKKKVVALSGGIKALEIMTGGGSVSYTRSDSVRGALGRLSFITDPFVAHSRAILKVCAVLLLVFIVAFGYLFFTMETEKEVVERIEKAKAQIESLQAPLPEIKEELWDIRKQIENIAQKELTRQEKAEVLDLNVKAFDLAEKLEKARVEMHMIQKRLDKDVQSLGEIKQKGFFDRILRR